MTRPLTRCLVAVCSVLLTGPLPAQVRQPVVESVELTVPLAPTAVRINGHATVVYELHVTNFLTVDVTVARLQVFAPGSTVPIADYRGHDLSRRLGRPGLRRGQADPQIVGAGLRAVAYLWMELPAGAEAPAALTHRLELDVARPTGAASVVVEGGATSLSAAAPLVLRPPLRGGPWVAIYDPLLVGGHRTAFFAIDGRARIPGRFAIDFVRLPASGTLEADVRPRPTDWNGYGSEVLAVADAAVVAAVDDIDDNADPPVRSGVPMPPEQASGNYVALNLGGGRFAFYEHLKRGSVTVKAGQRVTSGQAIGQLGNSGSSSIGPHLHFHVADTSAPLGAEGTPFVFGEFEQLGAFASIDALIGGSRWVAGPGEQDRARERERPAANVVVRFR